MLKVYNQQLEPLAILENAYDVSLERAVNELHYCSFRLPINDSKNEHCTHFNFIEVISKSGRNYGKFRIMPTNTSKKDNYIEYECEHVLATLLDEVMLGYNQYTNWTTRAVLEDILSMQSNWVLGECEFTRYFHYSFENENGLLAPILSIPKPFNQPYEFTYDTTVYPFVLNLVQPSNEVTSEIRWGKDMMSFDEVSDSSDIVNHLIPLGYGEGVNQLNVKEVNGGLPYIEDVNSINQYGVKKYIWIDRRFQNADSLLASAQSLLDQWKQPKISFDVKSADLSILPEYSHERKLLNGITRIIVDDKTYEARIIKETINDLDKEYEVQYSINNKLDDIATTQADVEKKIQVNEAYSQGSTNYDTFNANENCDPLNPVVVRFYLPGDLVNVNTMDLTYETTEFRAYSQATEGGGNTTETTSSGGSTTVTSASGGSAVVTSASGGSSSPTTTSQIFGALSIESETTNQSDFGTHFHRVNFTNEFDHAHTVNVPSHQHNVSLPSHQHNVSIPNHVHSLALPNHIHDIKHGIYKLSTLPTQVEIKVDGTIIPQTALTGEKIDIIPYLSKDGGGRIQRDTFHEVSIKPNDLGRVNINIISRLFISSHVGGVY